MPRLPSAPQAPLACEPSSSAAPMRVRGENRRSLARSEPPFPRSPSRCGRASSDRRPARSEGHWPILSPYSWVCGNLAGEFQYGTFSLFVNALVVLVWKFPLVFPQQAAALSIAHLFVLAIGAFLLVRGRGLSVALSIFVALLASFNGWIIC